MNVTLFGKRIFADITKFRVTPKSNGRSLDKRKAERILRHREAGHVMIEAEVGGMQPQTRDPFRGGETR